MIDDPVPTMPEMVPAISPTARTKRKLKATGLSCRLRRLSARGDTRRAASRTMAATRPSPDAERDITGLDCKGGASGRRFASGRQGDLTERLDERELQLAVHAA